MLAPGNVLSNRYRLQERVAAGGMGEVWRGADLLLRRGVAVKVLLPALMADAEFISRFRTEARLMARLRHPGIVQVYDYGEGADGLDYLVMEYVEGVPLSKRVRTAGRLGVAETMDVVAQAADALQVAHDAGIVHRDVKPGNLLVRPGGAVVLVDFGVARSAGVTGITSTNVVLGSVDYMAPEQAEGKTVSAVTDVYALGAVAYCCLTGRPPFPGDNPLQVLGQLVYGEPPTLPVEIPPAAAELVLRALDRDPERRHPSAAALAEAARAARDAPPGRANPTARAASSGGATSSGRDARPGRATSSGRDAPRGRVTSSGRVTSAAGVSPAAGPVPGRAELLVPAESGQASQKVRKGRKVRPRGRRVTVLALIVAGMLLVAGGVAVGLAVNATPNDQVPPAQEIRDGGPGSRPDRGGRPPAGPPDGGAVRKDAEDGP